MAKKSSYPTRSSPNYICCYNWLRVTVTTIIKTGTSLRLDQDVDRLVSSELRVWMWSGFKDVRVVEHGAAAAEAIWWSIRRLVVWLCLRVVLLENERVNKEGKQNTARLLPASQYAGFLLVYWFKAKAPVCRPLQPTLLSPYSPTAWVLNSAVRYATRYFVAWSQWVLFSFFF